MFERPLVKTEKTHWLRYEKIDANGKYMKKGFTLTELLVVIAILAVTVVIAVPVVSSITLKAGLSADTTTAQSIEMSIDTWMNTEYQNEAFFRGNLYTSMSSGEAATGRINGYTEQMYSYYFAGTEQLPGIELKNEAQIRHSVITAIKATSNMKLDIRSGEQFVQGPKAGAKYGFKYYYKIGRVNVERTDRTESALGEDEVYQYYVWLDQQGGSLSSETQPKKHKDSLSLDVSNSSLYAFRFNFGSRDMRNIRVVIEQEEQSYSFSGAVITPAMFRPGNYRFRFYYAGNLYKQIDSYDLAAGAEAIDAK